MPSPFFAFLARMKLIQRWSLMRNSSSENVQEHSLQTALIAHGLAVIRNRYFGGHIDEGRVAVAAMYHEVSEIFTGDMPTPVKYFNPEIREIYKGIEQLAQERLLKTLPIELQEDFRPVVLAESEGDIQQLVKSADKLCAYLKCVEELRVGNLEFQQAHGWIQAELEKNPLPEVQFFLEQFAPAFSLTLDELQS